MFGNLIKKANNLRSKAGQSTFNDNICKSSDEYLSGKFFIPLEHRIIQAVFGWIFPSIFLSIFWYTCLLHSQ